MFPLRLILLAVCCVAPWTLQAEVANLYPNELPGYRIFASARWRSLVPWESTAADVRRVLGDPKEAIDLAHYSDPYPGDAAVESGLFVYETGGQWNVYIYFVGPQYGDPGGKRYATPSTLRQRVGSIELLPKEPLLFKAEFPKLFTQREVIAADARWNDYRDGTGLCYSVYLQGQLNRIVYGPPEEKVRRYFAKEKSGS